MAATLDASFEVCRVIEPGSCMESLSEVMMKEVASLTTNDFLIISSGSNDISRNDSRLAFGNIVNYLKNVEHTNVILVSAPLRYDTVHFSHINNSIKLFNSKLSKLSKMFGYVSINEMVESRLLYTRQGSHLNRLGKEILSNQLGTLIFSLLERVKPKPIILKWHDKETQMDILPTTKPLLTQLPTRQLPIRNRKYQYLEMMIFLWNL
jgi:hypothetical protein